MNTPKELTVLVAEDHWLFRRAIREIFEDLPYVTCVDEAEDGIKCLEALEQKDYNLLVLDIKRQRMEGDKCLEEIRKRWPELKVIALTQYDEHGFYRKMKTYNVNGYLLKSVSEEELIESVEAVAFLGETVIAIDVQRKLIDNSGSVEIDFNTRELEILRLICKQAKTEEIACQLVMTVHNVNYYRKNIFHKAGVENLAGLAIWAKERGLV